MRGVVHNWLLFPLRMAAADLPPTPADAVAYQGVAAQAHATLEQGLWRLRFPAPLEQEFIAFLRDSQRRPLLALGIVGFLVVGVFGLLDFNRYFQVRDLPEAAALFHWGIFIPRWLCLGALLLSLGLVLRYRSRRLAARLTVIVFVLLGLSVFFSTAVYSNLGLPHATSSYLLVLVAVFLPTGLLFRESLLLGLALWLCANAVVHWVMLPSASDQRWVLVLMMVMALLMSTVSAYMREHAQREQFLLRRLVDWEATHDPLTGLANRRMFNAQADRLLLQSLRDGVPLSLALIDVDHFKPYNDRYGHLAGDEALRQVARLLAQHAARPLDLPVRLGGEEFGLLSYGESAESLGRRMQALLAQLRAQGIAHAGSPHGGVLTLSAGVAEARGRRSQDALCRDADLLLYQAKDAGRARVVVQPAPAPAVV